MAGWTSRTVLFSHVLAYLTAFNYAGSPALTNVCIAFESSYHVERGCACVIYESYGTTQGTFNSINFPSIYPPNLSCIMYTFIGDLDEIVELNFLEFDLQFPVMNKCTDFVKLFVDLDRPEVSDSQTPDYVLCGNISVIPKNFYSSKRSLILEFHTDAIQANNTGFRGIYRFLDKDQFDMEGGNKRWDSECTYDFYSSKNVKSGRFFSPRYPQPYPPKSVCHFFFYGYPDEVVKITFLNIQLELSTGPGCSSNGEGGDVLTIRDGITLEGNFILNRYCGTGNSLETITSGENASIEFLSDELIQRQGFAATFQFIRKDEILYRSPTEPERVPIQPDSNSKKNSNLKGRNVHSAHSSPHLPNGGYSEGSRSEESCDMEITSADQPSGKITSPFYPKHYPDDISCWFSFKGRPHERIQITFTDFDLTYHRGIPIEPFECEVSDSVRISTVLEASSADSDPLQVDLGGPYCGGKMPPMLMSGSHVMSVNFSSISMQSASASRGFSANYVFLSDFGIKSGEQDPSKECRFVYGSSHSSNGSFNSPNFPGLYPRSTECHYLFYGSDNERVHIEFLYIDIEGIQPGCLSSSHSDFIELSNFNVNVPDRKLSRLCGVSDDAASGSDINSEKVKKYVTSDGSFFRITFKSNEIYDGKGFKARYHFKKVEEVRDPDVTADRRFDWTSSVSNHVGRPNRLVIIVISILTARTISRLHLNSMTSRGDVIIR